MNVNIDPVESLRKKYAKEKVVKEKYINKRKELDLKIKKSDENMKKIKEDIENLEIDKTIKLIKFKGYSLSYIQDAIESGVLEQLNQQSFDNNVQNAVSNDQYSK